MASENRLSAQLVDLSQVLQSLAGQRRTGWLHVSALGHERWLGFSAGQIIGLAGAEPLFVRALGWVQAAEADSLERLLERLGDREHAVPVAQALKAEGLAAPEALLDAIDAHIQEALAEMLGWQQAEIELLPTPPSDPWIELQRSLNVGLNPSAVLLDCLRRQDEMAALAGQLPDRWDVLARDAAAPVPDDLDEDERIVLATFTGQAGEVAVGADLLDHGRIPPLRAAKAVAGLRRRGLLRVCSAKELAMAADAAYAQGRDLAAYNMYRRALAQGVDTARMRVNLATLAERAGDRAAAAQHFLAAVPQMGGTAPQAAAAALRNAVRLGADPEEPLQQLVEVHQRQGEKQQALEAQQALVRIYQERKDWPAAIEAVRRTQELGADPAAAALVMAQLSAQAGDRDQVVLQLEQAARLAAQEGEFAQSIAAWRKLLQFVPGNCEFARECSELLVMEGDKAGAAQVLRETLERQEGTSEDLLLQLFEMLARLDPDDTTAHDWLAQAYDRRRNRQGAKQQLLMVAARQEKDGDQLSLAVTLERILALGDEDPQVLAGLATARQKQGQERAAAEAWCRAVDAQLNAGQLKEARSLLDSALAGLPTVPGLRQRAAVAAVREGDNAAAIAHFRATSELLRCAGDRTGALAALDQVLRLRPDCVVSRIQVVELAQELNDPATEERLLREAARAVARLRNFGLAFAFTRRRIALAGSGPAAYAQRFELIELMRLARDTEGELAEGKSLLDEMLEAGDFERAVELLSRLVAAHPRNPDLMLQLAELHAGLDDGRQAGRFYRHAIALLQQDDRVADARKALDQLAQVSEDPRQIEAARRDLDAGTLIDWDRVARQSADPARRPNESTDMYRKRIGRAVPAAV